MKLTRTELKALNTTHKHVVDALICGSTVWEKCPVDGWVKTQSVYAHTPIENLFVGEVPPSEE